MKASRGHQRWKERAYKIVSGERTRLFLARRKRCSASSHVVRRFRRIQSIRRRLSFVYINGKNGTVLYHTLLKMNIDLRNHGGADHVTDVILFSTCVSFEAHKFSGLVLHPQDHHTSLIVSE